jgi:hypothetical protein
MIKKYKQKVESRGTLFVKFIKMNFSRQNSLRGFREDSKKSFFKKKELNIENEQEFPFIHKEDKSKPEENMEEHQMNYKEASLIKKQSVQEEDIEPGWIYLHADMLKNPKNKIQKNQRNSESDEELNDEEFKKKANRVFSTMVNRWEKYKRRHKEFYGETHRSELDYVCESQGEESSDEEENEDNDEYLSS